MIVCLCRAVSSRQLAEVIAGGATTLDAVARRCGAGTDCGTCREQLAACLDDADEPRPCPTQPEMR